MSMLQQTNRAGHPDKALQQAYDDALAFLPSRANVLAITPAQSSSYAEQEAAFPTITVDENGMSNGMRSNLLEPVQNLASEWRSLWNKLRGRDSAKDGGYQRGTEAPCRGGRGNTSEGRTVGRA